MNWKFCLAALAALSLNSFGQGGIILRGGLDFGSSTFDPSPPSDIDIGFRTGFNAELMGDIPLTPVVHALVGAGFEAKGWTENGEGADATFNSNYIALPLMLSFGTPSMGPSGPQPRLFFNAGIEPALLVSSTGEDNNGNSGDVTNVATFDFGLRGEIGGQFPLSRSMSGIIGAGYTYDVTNWVNDDSGEDGHNYVIQIFVGLEFGLSGMGMAAH